MISPNITIKIIDLYDNNTNKQIVNKNVDQIKPKGLAAKIKSIDSFGLMTVEFNQTIDINNFKISIINQTNTLITLLPA